jgi:hypothetical protein
VNRDGQAAFAGGGDEAFGDPFALRVAEGVAFAVFGGVGFGEGAAAVGAGVEDAGGGNVVDGLGCAVGGEAEDLERAGDVGSFERGVGVEEIQPRPVVVDGVDGVGERREG